MKKTIIILILIYASGSLSAQKNMHAVMDTLKTIGAKKNDYYQYVSSGNEKFNRSQFILAEKDYLVALKYLLEDSIEKKIHKNNYSVGQLVIYKSLLEVNRGLKDQKDVIKYSSIIKNGEDQFAKDPAMDISDYFETQAKDQYKRKEFKDALKNIRLGIISCKNAKRKESLKIFGEEIEAINKFLNKDYNSALVSCNKVLATQPGNSTVLDLRGRVYNALGNNTNACKDWKKAKELNYAISALRLSRYCK